MLQLPLQQVSWLLNSCFLMGYPQVLLNNPEVYKSGADIDIDSYSGCKPIHAACSLVYTYYIVRLIQNDAACKNEYEFKLLRSPMLMLLDRTLVTMFFEIQHPTQLYYENAHLYDFPWLMTINMMCVALTADFTSISKNPECPFQWRLPRFG